MLAQILKEMWVEPEVLQALCEDQRRILFLKMREEQVRRWREREESEEREGGAEDHARPRKGPGKSVSWLLDVDGDVCVQVIGDEDELRSSKLLKTLHNNRLQSADVSGLKLNGTQSQSLLSERETLQPGIRLLLNGDSVTRCHGGSKDSEEEDQDSGSAEDDPKDPSDSEDSGSGADDPKDWSLIYRPHPRSTDLPPPHPQLSITAQSRPQHRETVDPATEDGSQVFGARVARLRRAFAGSNLSAKLPVPSKPPHMLVDTTSIR